MGLGRAMKEQPAGHALLISLPFQGHINPLMQLGVRLAALGVRVTFVTTHRLRTQILRSQEALAQPITSRHAHFALVGLPDGLPDVPLSNRDLLDGFGALEDPVFELVHTLAAQGFPTTCIIADYFVNWTSSLASRTCLPEFIFWPQCVSMFAIFLHRDALSAVIPFLQVHAAEESGAKGPDLMEKVKCIPSISHLDIRYADLPNQGPKRTWLAEWIESIIKHRQKQLPRAQGVLMNSFDGLEAEVSRILARELQELGSSMRLIGPLVASAREGSGTSLWEEEVECMEWLDRQPMGSVIFVAFGSLTTMSSREQVQEVARGLVASGHRFLWVLRKNAINASNGDVAMKTEDILTYGFLDEIEGKGKVINWASQVKVLSHPSVGGFFSHCGWNSTLESIIAGVPILGWPSYVDQYPNCRLISHVWGMGLELQRDSLNETSRVHVANGVMELMKGPRAQDMRARAIELKNLATKAAISLQELHALVNDINKVK